MDFNRKKVTDNRNNVIMRKECFRDYEFATCCDPDLPAWVRSVGHFRLKEPDPGSWKTASFGELFWCIDGRGSFELDGKTYPVHPGEVWYYPPGSRHRYVPADSCFEYRWFTIAGKTAHHLFESAGVPRGRSFGGRCPEELFAQIELLIRQNTRRKRLKLLSVGFEILCLAASGLREKRPANDYLLEARRLIDRDFADPELSIKRLSEILHVNRVQLSREFSRQHGVTISAYLRNLRLQKGLKMLRETRLSIREIALSCGFASADYFGKVIVSATGEIPSMHRTAGPVCRKR